MPFRVHNEVMSDHLSKSEIGKDAIQSTVEAAATTVGQVAVIVTKAVQDIAGAVGGLATEFYEIREAARKATDEHGEKEMTVEVPLLCADGCRNCFAPSCCNQVFSMPIKPVGGGDAIGSLENHFPGCNCRGLCMAGGANNNYVVRFPRDASPHSKARLLSALHLIDFNFFERRGNQK